MNKGYRLLTDYYFDNQAVKAYDYFEKQSEGLGTRFFDSLGECLAIIERNPHTYQIQYKGTRAGYLKKFPYVVVYSINEQSKEVQIIDLYGQSQDWKEY